MNRLVYLPEVVTLRLDPERCNGCGMCVKVCPHAVFAMANKKALIVARDACMECGACAMNCSEEAITVASGVGCAAALLRAAITNSQPTCGCSSDSASCS